MALMLNSKPLNYYRDLGGSVSQLLTTSHFVYFELLLTKDESPFFQVFASFYPC